MPFWYIDNFMYMNVIRLPPLIFVDVLRGVK